MPRLGPIGAGERQSARELPGARARFERVLAGSQSELQLDVDSRLQGHAVKLALNHPIIA